MCKKTINNHSKLHMKWLPNTITAAIINDPCRDMPPITTELVTVRGVALDKFKVHIPMLCASN